MKDTGWVVEQEILGKYVPIFHTDWVSCTKAGLIIKMQINLNTHVDYCFLLESSGMLNFSLSSPQEFMNSEQS